MGLPLRVRSQILDLGLWRLGGRIAAQELGRHCPARSSIANCTSRERANGVSFLEEIVLVPMEGVEPTHPCGYQILNLARLPIPPHRQFRQPTSYTKPLLLQPLVWAQRAVPNSWRPYRESNPGYHRERVVS